MVLWTLLSNKYRCWMDNCWTPSLIQSRIIWVKDSILYTMCLFKSGWGWLHNSYGSFKNYCPNFQFVYNYALTSHQKQVWTQNFGDFELARGSNLCGQLMYLYVEMVHDILTVFLLLLKFKGLFDGFAHQKWNRRKF